MLHIFDVLQPCFSLKEPVQMESGQVSLFNEITDNYLVIFGKKGQKQKY